MGGFALVAPIRLCGLVPDPSVVFGLGLLSESVSGDFLAWVYRLTLLGRMYRHYPSIASRNIFLTDFAI